jgi:hypothetical protein
MNEALPYTEVKSTPYVVLCTTSLGGHLSWFEMDGHRWHAKPAINFLNKMAFEVEVQSPAETNGDVKSDESGPRFNAMRRRWHV